jgi:hypothetical protein
MPGELKEMRKNLLTNAVAVALLALSAKAAQGQVLYDSGGFENTTRFSQTFTNGIEQTTGTLRDQDAAVKQWLYSVNPPSSANTLTSTSAFAQVVATSAGDPVSVGSQDIKVSRISADTRWAPVFSPTVNATGSIVKISWSMDLATESDQSNFGPFFGIEAYSGTSNRIGGAGIDASTGELLFYDNGPSHLGLTPVTNTIPGTGWHTYELDFNYATQLYSVSLDGVVKVTNSPFENDSSLPAQTQFQDAPITTLVDQPGGNTAGTAFFDNYVVSLVPEPGAIGLFVIGVLTLKRRRMI